VTFDDYYKMFPRTRCLPEVRYACKFLESRGQRFGVDFGLLNSVAKAAEILIEEFGFEEEW
jgi:hypothetical protein